jgi:hypothetical protein
MPVAVDDLAVLAQAAALLWHWRSMGVQRVRSVDRNGRGQVW